MFMPPWGLAPFSDFDQDAALPPAPGPTVVLADDIDPNTGDFLSFKGVHPGDAHVRWMFQVQRGSGAAIGRAGNQFHTIETIDDRTDQALVDETKRIFNVLGEDLVVLQKPGGVDEEGLEIPAVRTETSELYQQGSLVADYFNVLAARTSSVRRPLG